MQFKSSLAYHLTTQTGTEVELYLAPPSQFIGDRWRKLLPDWQAPPISAIVVLLRSQYPLEDEGEAIEREKERLLQEFLKLSEKLRERCFQQSEFLLEAICPKQGTPIYSTPGEIMVSLVSVVHQLLGFEFFPTIKGCRVLKHPRWQTALYPGLLLSQSPRAAIEPALTALSKEILT